MLRRVIAALAGVDDKHGLGRINAAVKRALLSAETAFHSVSFGAGRAGRAEEENAVCFFVSRGRDRTTAGAGVSPCPARGRAGGTGFAFFFSRVWPRFARLKVLACGAACSMPVRPTTQSPFVVVFCFWCWCYLGQAYPGFWYCTAPCPGQPLTRHRFCRITM